MLEMSLILASQFQYIQCNSTYFTYSNYLIGILLNIFNIYFTCRLPPARSAHGAAIYKDNLWIFAGYDGNKRYLSGHITITTCLLWKSYKIKSAQLHHQNGITMKTWEKAIQELGKGKARLIKIIFILL